MIEFRESMQMNTGLSIYIILQDGIDIGTATLEELKEIQIALNDFLVDK